MKTEKTTRYFIDQKKGTISVCTSQGWITLPIEAQAFMEAMEGWSKAVTEIGEKKLRKTLQDE